jgi:hypothetical protein
MLAAPATARIFVVAGFTLILLAVRRGRRDSIDFRIRGPLRFT